MEILLGFGFLIAGCYCFRVREKTRAEIAAIVERRLLESDENYCRVKLSEVAYAHERERWLLSDGKDPK